MKHLLLFLFFLLLIKSSSIAQCTITGTTNTSDLNPNPCAADKLVNCNGVVNIGNGSTPTRLVMNADLDLSCLGPIQLIIKSNAVIDYSTANNRLTLAEGSSIFFEGTGTLNPLGGGGGSGCQGADRIIIGTTNISSCNGQSGIFSFEELVNNGGYAGTAGKIGSDQTICSGNVPASLTSIIGAGVSGITSYFWQTNASGTFVTIPGATAASYTPPALNTTTQFRRGITINGATSFTVPVTITVNAPPAAPVLANISLTCNQTAATQTWSASTNSNQYLVDVASDPNFSTYLPDYQNRAVIPSSTSTESLTINGLLRGQTYYIRVKTVTNCGTSAFSNTATLSIPISQSSDGITWDNGGLSIDKIARFTGNANINVNSSLEACSCIVDSGVNVNVNSLGELKLENGLEVLGSLIFENNSSLIQINPTAVNTGTITYKRISTPMKEFDYTYWSSPLKFQEAKFLSPNTEAGKYFRYTPPLGWESYNGLMAPGQGYIIQVPKPTFWEDPNSPTWAQKVVFNSGEPNNGNIEYPNTIGPNQYHLVGNPYASAINANTFIDENIGTINGTLYFWTHNTAIQQIGNAKFYVANDYAVYTKTGGIGTTTGMNNNTPNGIIGIAQGFFVRANAAPNPTKIVFNNAMRVSTVDDPDKLFFKQNSTKKSTSEEKNRIWLNLTNTQGAFKQLLVGYITGATNDWDPSYDGPAFNGQPYVNFYSINTGRKLSIQGRALPFDINDQIPIGYQSTINEGTLEIAIDRRDGSLTNQTIWLEDKKLGITHDLTQSKYTFTAIKGTEDDRFVLKYTNKTAKSFDNTLAKKSIMVSVKNKSIEISSEKEPIAKIQVFDLLGLKLYEKSKINTAVWTIESLSIPNQTLIVKTTLANGVKSNTKIIY